METRQNKMKIRVILEYDNETKSYAAFCPEIPGLTSCGDTENEALDNFHEAIELYFEATEIPITNQMKVMEIAI